MMDLYSKDQEVLDALIADIPGLSVTSTSRSSMADVNGVVVDKVEFGMMGWSPTFHQRRRTWQVVDRTGGGDMSKWVKPWIAARADRQREIQQAAAAMGIRAPIPKPGRILAHDVGHLTIDRHAADMLVARLTPRHAVRRIASLMQDLLTDDGDDEQLLATREILAGESSATVSLLRGRPWMTIRFDIGSEHRAILDGSTLHMPWFEMPATLMAACAGRRLGDVVDAGEPLLEAATIATARAGMFGGTDVNLLADPVRIDQHPGLVEELPAITAIRP